MKSGLAIRRGLVFVVILCMFLVSGCDGRETQIEDSTDAYESSVPAYSPTTPGNEKIEVIETNPTMLGEFTLDDCKSLEGIFIAHDDGSFSRFYGGGFIEESSMRNTTGMYLRNSFLNRNPVISKNDKLVLFCESSYDIEFLPVNWEIGVIYTELEDDTNGYTYAHKQGESVKFYTYLSNYETNWNTIKFVDGIAVNDYPFEIVQGGPKNTTGCGLPKGETVKIGYQAGSALVEVECEVNATYYDCDVIRNLGGVNVDQYCISVTPTTDGYAVISLYDEKNDREVPSGKYVMVLRMGRSYIAYLLNWENS